MERPVSIVWFERCYLGSVAVGLLNTIVSWKASLDAATTKLSDNPATAQLGPAFGANVMIGTTVVMLLISALLWYLTARKGSVVTKWIVTVFFVLGVLGLLMSIAQGTIPQGISAVLAVVALVLDGIAVWQLFKPDTKLWFGETAA